MTTTTPPRNDAWLPHAIALLPASIAALVAHWNAAATFFTCDDLVALSAAAGLEPMAATFRPLSAVVIPRIEHALFGLSPLGYHGVNLALHLIATAGVYALAWRISGSRSMAGVAAVLFSCSGVAFTPLHAASGAGDLAAAVLLLAATLLYWNARRRATVVPLLAGAVCAFAAMLAKEGAVVWPAFALLVECTAPAGSRSRSRIAFLAACGVVMAAWLTFIARRPESPSTGPYGLDFSVVHLLTNLATYLSWSAAIGAPLRDLVAAADPASWPLALGASIAMLAVYLWGDRRWRPPLALGAAWWAIFVLPALPLAHHTYLYYLYIPWIGGALAIAAALMAIAERIAAWGEGRRLGDRRWLVSGFAWGALAVYVVAEAQAIRVRERATLDAVPADRTLREASLMRHAIAGLRAVSLPAGTAVGFVNPVPREAYRLPARAEDGHRARYVPLEEALCHGRALRLFVPGLIDSGFATAIPPSWTEVECFLYEQRGWLRHWGRGQAALMRQAELQAFEGRWAAAEASFARARRLGDTLPDAVAGHAAALSRLGRHEEAMALADTFASRWADDPRGPLLRNADRGAPVDARLIRPFDRTLAPLGAPN